MATGQYQPTIEWLSWKMVRLLDPVGAPNGPEDLVTEVKMRQLRCEAEDLGEHTR